jgi:hypothetical protein
MLRHQFVTYCGICPAMREPLIAIAALLMFGVEIVDTILLWRLRDYRLLASGFRRFTIALSRRASGNPGWTSHKHLGERGGFFAAQMVQSGT